MLNLDEVKKAIAKRFYENHIDKEDLLDLAAKYANENNLNVENLQKYTASLIYPYTDLGNAERLYIKRGDDFKWVTERQRFIIWNTKNWEYDTSDNTQMVKWAIETVHDIPTEPDPPGDKGYEQKLRWALSSQGGKRLREMLVLVKAVENTTVSVNRLDTDNYLFNCRNVTIDLRNGQPRAHSKDDFITMVAPVTYDETAKCPKWLDFLNLTQSENQEMIIFLQKICGYAMTGDIRTKIIPFCHGVSGAGKSTFWGVIRDIEGDYSTEVDPSVFLTNENNYRDSGQREAMANLYGKRLVTCTEITDGKTLSTALLKSISGSEGITADRKYEHEIKFKPTFKVILAGNSEPTIKDDTDGTWSRLKKIPFNVKIPNPKEGFNNLYSDELPGIFNWMIEGCLLWQSEGIQDPKLVINATQKYRDDQNLISQFISERCIVNVKSEVPIKSLKEAYKNWCFSNSIKPSGPGEFKQKMKTLNFEEGFSPSGLARVWKGLGLLEMLHEETDKTDKNNPQPPHEPISQGTSKENSVSNCQIASLSDKKISENPLPEDIFSFWVSLGKPIIHLGPGENCKDLEKLLSSQPNEHQSTALKNWHNAKAKRKSIMRVLKIDNPKDPPGWIGNLYFPAGAAGPAFGISITPDGTVHFPVLKPEVGEVREMQRKPVQPLAQPVESFKQVVPPTPRQNVTDNERLCAICGKPAPGKRQDRLYCGPRCRKIASRSGKQLPMQGIQKCE